MSEETTQEATVDQWAEAIGDSQLILDDDLALADVAAEFEDDVARKTMTELCQEAVLQTDPNRTAVILEDFRAARDVLEAEDEDDEESTQSAEVSLEAMSSKAQEPESNPDSPPDEPTLEKDSSLPTDSQSSSTNGDTNSSGEPAPSSMDRDALEEEIADNRERIERLEAQQESCQETNRRVAIMRGALLELFGADVVDDISDFREAAQQFRTEHVRADRAVREGAVSNGSENNRTKVELAMDLAKAEGVRVSRKGLQGGAIDFPTVRGIADRQHDTDLHSSTVYEAFDRLENRWPCFEVKEGEDGPNTPNKQLRCVRNDIPQSLLDQLQPEGN